MLYILGRLNGKRMQLSGDKMHLDGLDFLE